MSLNGALRALKQRNTSEANGTTSVTQLPANILEAFIPGYSIIAQFLLDVVGIDATLLVSFCLLAFGLVTSAKYLWSHAYAQFRRHCMSNIMIDSDDDLYDQLLDWITTQKVSKRSRKLIAKTDREDALDFVDEDEDLVVDSENLVNFSNLEAKVPPKFQPSFGIHPFFHRGRLFIFERDEKQVMSSGWGASMFRDEEKVTLTCVGRSTQPIKDLIAEARLHVYRKEKSCTAIRRPAPKEHRNRGRFWTKVATRPSRPMDTVVLDHEQKTKLLNDINEYLHHNTRLWYAQRGIPYRRGYLFHGPPGTGKTSLAWAIAGVFGLDVYNISLVDPTLTEEELSLLFSNLPRRCVVLLEDIDAAGLSNRQEEAAAAERKTENSSDETARIGAEITKAFETVRKNSEKYKDKQGITLSGLLNAIDGVASHEGRVLVMTSNFAERLDDALIRPGRVDMKIEFTNASQSQVYELFTRMYTPDLKYNKAPSPIKGSFKLESVPKKTNGSHTLKNPFPTQPTVTNPIKASNPTPPETPKRLPSPAGSNDDKKPLNDLPPSSSNSTLTDIESIASRFAEQIPDKVFSPAEIQGFLLTRKGEPLRALNEVATWRDATIAAKENKTKMATGEPNIVQ